VPHIQAVVCNYDIIPDRKDDAEPLLLAPISQVKKVMYSRPMGAPELMRYFHFYWADAEYGRDEAKSEK
jgi:hypothetical protein